MLRTGRTTVNVELESARDMVELRRLARELRLTDQILADDIEAVTIQPSAPYPAFTTPDGSSITFAWSKMPLPWTRKGLAVWLGTNAHELGHSLFSPRQDSKLMRRVTAGEASSMRGVHQAWNVLEDQRMERLMLGTFKAWRGYLIAALAHHIDVTHTMAWLLVAGRTWLPQVARDGARAVFVAATANDQEAADAASLIGAYQGLADPGDTQSDEAWAIVSAFHQLLQRVDMPMPPTQCGGQVPVHGEPSADGDEAQGRAEAIPVADDEPEDDEPEDESGAGGDDQDDDDADDGDDGDDGSDGDDDEGDDGSDSDGDDGDDDGDGADAGGGDDDEGDSSVATNDEGDEGDDEPGDGVGHDPDNKTNGTPTPDDIKDAIGDAIDEALNEDDVAADLDRIKDAVEHGTPGDPDGPKAHGQLIDADDQATMLERDVSEALMDLRDEAEPGWVKRTAAGRFNVRRWATDPHWTPDDVFDQYQPGQLDAASFEVVSVLDVSGSMHSQLRKLGVAAWAIRRAVDGLEGRCTTLTFHDWWAVLAPPSERPDGRVFVPAACGGTEPSGALREAHRIMSESEAPQRVVVVLTDGEWWDHDGMQQRAVEAIKETGAVTILAGLGTGVKVKPGMYGFDYVQHISDPADLARLFRDVAVDMMQRAMAHA